MSTEVVSAPQLEAAGTAAAWGDAAAFIGVTLLGVAGVILAITSSRSRSKDVSDLG
jgi:hypothetical protein